MNILEIFPIALNVTLIVFAAFLALFTKPLANYDNSKILTFCILGFIITFDILFLYSASYKESIVHLIIIFSSLLLPDSSFASKHLALAYFAKNLITITPLLLIFIGKHYKFFSKKTFLDYSFYCIVWTLLAITYWLNTKIAVNVIGFFSVALITWLLILFIKKDALRYTLTVLNIFNFIILISIL